MQRFASTTTVPVERTRGEIETLLRKHGATGVSMFEQEFLEFIVASDGRTVGEHIVPQLGNGTPGRLMLTAPREAPRA